MSNLPVLVISPIPSHPQQQGNSARIYRLAQLFQLKGHPVHFIYFGLEGLTSEQEHDMRNTWESFYFIRPEGPAPEPSLGDYYHVDDWYDDRVGDLVEKLCESWDYAACLVNYVWFSKVLDHVPESVCKLIDTHDVFGDRHIIAKQAGLEPVWFYTSSELEAWALNRADVVIAIQDEEAMHFRGVIEKPVVTIGYVIPEQSVPVKKKTPGKQKVGYLGSGNPFNVTSVLSFFNSLDESVINSNLVEFHLAGTICKAVSGRIPDNVLCWGVVQNVSDFYVEMDVLLNPMVGGTGLKIKSVEVLAFGKPLIATADAMVGICDFSERGVYETTQAMASSFKNGVDGPYISSQVWNNYIQDNMSAFEELYLEIM